MALDYSAFGDTPLRENRSGRTALTRTRRKGIDYSAFGIAEEEEVVPSGYQSIFGDLTLPPRPVTTTRTSTQAIPDETTPSTAGFVKEVVGYPLRVGVQGALTLAPESVRENVGQITPETDFGKFAASFIGKEPINPAQVDIPAVVASLKEQGYGDFMSNVIAHVGVNGNIAIGMLPFVGQLERGGIKALSKLLASIKDAKSIETILLRNGVEETLARDYSKMFAPLKDSGKIEKGLLNLEKIQNTTKPPPIAKQIGQSVEEKVPTKSATFIDSFGQTRSVEIVTSPVSELKPAFEDWTQLSSKVKPLSEDISISGIKTPLIVNKVSGEVLDGNKRLLSAKELGIKEVPVVYVNDGNVALYDVSALRTQLPTLPKKITSTPRIAQIPPLHIQEMKQEIEILRDILPDMPGRGLVKYVSSETGALPGIKEGQGKFAKRGDTIVQEAVGQEASRQGDLDVAQKLVDEYRAAASRLKRLEAQYREAVNAHREQRILNEMAARLDRDTERLRRFTEKYPELARATQTLGTAETRGALVGYRVGKQVAAKEILDTLRTTQRSTKEVKNAIINYAKQLPASERGKLLTVVRDAKTQKDLTKAFIRIDKAVEKFRIKEAVTNLRATAEKLSESPSIAVDYRDRIKDIIDEYELSGHTEQTIKRLQATQAYLDGVVAAGGEVEIPQRILDKLKILTRIPKDKLTLVQIQGIQNEIELLGRLGKTKWATKQALYEGEKEMRAAELLSIRSPINYLKLPEVPIGERPAAYVRAYIKARNEIMETRLGLRPMDGVAEITGMVPVKDRLDFTFGNYLDRDIPEVPNFAALEQEIYDAGLMLDDTARARVGVYGLAQQKGGPEKLFNRGITREQVDAIQLTAEEERLYRAIRSFNNETYPAVKKYMADVYNADVGQVDNYMSFHTDFDAMSELEIFDRYAGRADEAFRHRTKKVEEGFTQSRTGAGKQRVQIDAMKIAGRHVDDVAYMLAMGRDIKMYSEIINTPEMGEKLGDLGQLAWKEYMDLMARKGGVDSAQRIAVLDILRRNLGAGVLAFRLSSAAVQVTSLVDSAASIGIDATWSGARKIATSKEWRNFVMDNFPEIRKAVGDDPTFREFGTGVLERGAKVGMYPLVKIDGAMRAIVAAGAYEKAAAARGIVVDLSKPDRQLIQEATKLMRESQSSSFFKDAPLAVTRGFGLTGNKSLNSAITTFQTFILNRWENIERHVWRLGLKKGDYAHAASSFMLLIVAAGILEEGVRRGVRSVVNLVTGDDKEEKSYAANAAFNAVQGIPLFGNLMSALTYSSNPVPVINTLDDTIRGLGSVVGGKQLSTKVRGAVQAAGAAGALGGVPGSTQAADLIRKAIPQATNSNSNTKTKPIKIQIKPPGNVLKKGQKSTSPIRIKTSRASTPGEGFTRALAFLTGAKSAKAAAIPADEYYIRDNVINVPDLLMASAVLFGEISNRSIEKQKLEAQVIMNTALNRMDQYREHGMDMSLSRVLQVKNQYQAYGDKEYTRFLTGQLRDTDRQKMQAIEDVLAKIKDGTFQNNIGEDVFYSHKPDGRIYTKPGRLFK